MPSTCATSIKMRWKKFLTSFSTCLSGLATLAKSEFAQLLENNEKTLTPSRVVETCQTLSVVTQRKQINVSDKRSFEEFEEKLKNTQIIFVASSSHFMKLSPSINSQNFYVIMDTSDIYLNEVDT